MRQCLSQRSQFTPGGAVAWLQLGQRCVSKWSKSWDDRDIIWEALFLLFKSKLDKPGITFQLIILLLSLNLL